MRCYITTSPFFTQCINLFEIKGALRCFPITSRSKGKSQSRRYQNRRPNDRLSLIITHVSIVQPYRNCMSCLRDMSVSGILTIPHSLRDNTRSTSTHTAPCTALRTDFHFFRLLLPEKENIFGARFYHYFSIHSLPAFHAWPTFSPTV